jgi:ergothioneine biosynthesis protein EgtB
MWLPVSTVASRTFHISCDPAMATASRAAPRLTGYPWRSSVPLLDRYCAVRARTLALAEPLSAEDQLVQSMPDASPTKWHLAHTAWFFETFVLGPHVPGYRPFDERFKFLFNSYYETVGAQPPRDERGLLSRPSRADVLAYRRHVDDAILGLMGRLERGDAHDDARAIVELGLHHEEQHQELILTDIKHALHANPLRPGYGAARGGRAEAPDVRPAPLAPRTFEEGLVWIGHDGSGFAFDNEGPRHRRFQRAFALGDRPVTCGEYLGFMEDRGYERPELWLSDGWRECQAVGWHAPLYWERRDDAWALYTLAGTRPVDAREAVAHVSYYEADAFARWAGMRLPTEDEWERAAQDAPIAGHFADDDRLHPGAARPGMFGDVWQWTQSPYGAYPGYRPPAGAVGEYNGKFMCNQLVLRGGSCFTPAGHVRPTYRNFFPPATRWQASGIRLARDA